MAGVRSRLLDLTWLLGCLLLAIVALMAAWSTGDALGAAALAFGVRLPLRVPGVALAVGTAWLAVRGRRAIPPGVLESRWLPVAGVAVVGMTRVLATARWDAPLISDFRQYHTLAENVLRGGGWFSEVVPMGYPLLLGATYRLAGVHTWAGEALNVVLAIGTSVVLYGFVRRTWGPRAAVLALALYALFPAQVLMTAVLGTEVVYGAVLLGALWAWSETEALGWRMALVAGVLLGLSQYVRPTSLALAAVFVATLGLMRLGLAGMLTRAGAFALAFVVVLLPVLRYNWQQAHQLSLSTSSYAGWSLLVGANQRSVGQWNIEDARLVEKEPSIRARDALAAREARRRIAADPVAYARLIVRKLPVMWASEGYAPYWVMGTADDPPRHATALWTLVSQIVYAATLMVAAWALVRLAPFDPAAVVIVLTLLAFAAIHSLLEVQGRYHFSVVPLFIVLAGVGLARLDAGYQTTNL